MNEKKEFLDRVESFVVKRFPFVSVPVARFIACLAAIESDFGGSKIALENHNLVGMKVPKFRLSTCIGENRGHAVYPSDESCICDFFYWLQYNRFCQGNFRTLKGFLLHFKKCNYNPSSSYVDYILNLKNQYYEQN